jgi:hypothetical protein
MSQPSGPNPPGWGTPPPPAPGYGAAPYSGPPGYAPPPPRRGGPPWWVWVLGGCGGCLVLAVVLLMLGVGYVGSVVKSVANTNVTPQTVRQDLGAEVPSYPNATLDLDATKGATIAFRAIEKAAGQKPGAIFRGMGIYDSKDKPDKIRKYYDAQLKKQGWNPEKTGNTTGSEVEYRKGNEYLTVEAEDAEGGGSTVTVMRGGPEMIKMMPSSSSGK